MNIRIYILFFFAVSFLHSVSFSQKEPDSLLRILQTTQVDTLKIKVLLKLAVHAGHDPDSALKLSLSAKEIAERANNPLGIARAEHMLGWVYSLKNNFSESYAHSIKALEGYIKLYPPDGGVKAASALNTIGYNCLNKSEYAKALGYFFRGLKISEAHQDTLIQLQIAGNIGIVYSRLEDPNKGFAFFNKALKLSEQINSLSDIARYTGNIGTMYADHSDYKKGLYYLFKAKKTAIELDDKRLLSSTLGNIGIIYKKMGEYGPAMDYYSEALKIDEEVHDELSQALDLGNIALLYIDLKNYEAGKKHLDRSLDLCYKLNYFEGIVNFEKTYSELSAILHDHEAAFGHYKKFIAYRDSISNEENTKRQTQLEMQFEFDKKQAADSVKVAEEKKVAAAELAAEKNKSYTLYGGLALVLVFAGFMYNRFRVTQKQKKIIEVQKITVEKQKQIVEERNKEVTDSIYYARRIQRALLPTEKHITKLLKG